MPSMNAEAYSSGCGLASSKADCSQLKIGNWRVQRFGANPAQVLLTSRWWAPLYQLFEAQVALRPEAVALT